MLVLPAHLQAPQKEPALKTFRLGVGGLGIISIALMVYIVFFNPLGGERNSVREYAFLCCGLPILMLNFIAWAYPRSAMCQ